MRRLVNVWIVGCVLCAAGIAFADPCGMVPPLTDGPGVPITRIGEQQTYVFFKDGVESIVIRPGFSGKIDEFGMLIPFPSPPALRKMPDNIFAHLATAVDPPEVVINLFPEIKKKAQLFDTASKSFFLGIDRGAVRVLRREAVGMYEVAVLEAGSARALQRWMDNHGFRYPDGMDKVTEEYIKIGWCFVAVKTKVGQKHGVDPKPSQRTVNSRLPAGSTFDGFVQAMGFRFRTEKLVVPMRLSAFNDGELRNIVYLLTDGPQKIRSIPEEYVVRQISGRQLFKNVTGPLPLRILGGTMADLTEWHLKNLAQRRDPTEKNGSAKLLFASDLLAVKASQLSLPQEEQEKELLRIGEHFGLRGADIDRLNDTALAAQAESTIKAALKDIDRMTLTVVDGDFPREVLARQNLTFGEYRIPTPRNTRRAYDANLKGPAPKKNGLLIIGALDQEALRRHTVASSSMPSVGWVSIPLTFSLIAMGLVLLRRTRKKNPAPDLGQ